MSNSKPLWDGGTVCMMSEYFISMKHSRQNKPANRVKHNNFKVLIETSQATGSSFICVDGDGDSIDNDLLYLIGQNFAGQNFCRTKYFAGQKNRH